MNLNKAVAQAMKIQPLQVPVTQFETLNPANILPNQKDKVSMELQKIQTRKTY